MYVEYWYNACDLYGTSLNLPSISYSRSSVDCISLEKVKVQNHVYTGVYLITGLDYWTWTHRPHPFIVLLDFILKSKQATGLKLCNLI